MQTRVKLACNNMQSSDPWATYVDEHINEAANAVLLLAISRDRRNVNLFPELRQRRYYDVTVNAQGYLERPSSLLILDTVSYTKTTTAYDPSRHTEYPVIEEPDQARFGLLDKTSTTVGYPQIFHDAATQILLWPTPTTAFLTQVVVRGMRKETALTTDGQTFQMNELFHPVIIDYATYLTMQRMGLDEAEKFLTAAEKRLTQTINLLALSNRRERSRIEVAGTP
jgi:hypothetical protein